MQDQDIITLSGLKAVANHGVYDFERSGSQEFIADITLFVDLDKAGTSDDVADTVDYSVLAQQAMEILSGPAVNLIETLAIRIVDLALRYKGVNKAQVTVHKPMAPMDLRFSDVSVTVVRKAPADAEVAPPPLPEEREVEAVPEPVARPELPSRLERLRAERKQRAEELAQSYRSSHVPVKPDEIVSKPVLEPQVETQVEPEQKQYVYQVVLSLGANKGPVVRTLREAVSALADLDGFEVDEVSPLVQTKPVLEPGMLPQDDYLNAIVLGHTVLAPPALLAALQEIEASFGRVRTTRWGARTLDIDIIDLDRMQLATRSLVLPHPRAHTRAFVLYPWLLVDPDARLTGHGEVGVLLEHAGDLDGVLAQYPDWLAGSDDDLGERIVIGSAETADPTEAPRLPADAPQVSLRGEKVPLADISRDPIFRKLLEAEAQPPAEPMSPPPPPPVLSFQREPEPETAPIAVEAPASPVPQARPAPPPSRRRAGAPTSARRLPDWDFEAHRQHVRVVDSVGRPTSSEPNGDAGSGSGTNREQSPPPRLARGVTVRPTPTGNQPVMRRPSVNRH